MLYRINSVQRKVNATIYIILTPFFILNSRGNIFVAESNTILTCVKIHHYGNKIGETPVVQNILYCQTVKNVLRQHFGKTCFP